MKIEMTGKEDREGPWKIAVCGFPGSGKTLFASTAPNPLFVFFAEDPRLKSIARRHIPHVKITNIKNVDGGLEASVQDQLGFLLMRLLGDDHDYKTLVIDTGNELFQAMKEARRLRNHGEFGVADWGWLADAYREVITGIIDLPMNVIVLYHIKSSQEGEDGNLIREVMLQGSSKDEVASWFDVIGVMDTYETTNEDGDTVTKRVFLTHSSRTYPWVKDHSGSLPRRFEISDNFVGDYQRMYDLLVAEEEEFSEGQEHAVLEAFETVQEDVVSGLPVPTPDELQAKKQEKAQPESRPGGDEGVDSEAQVTTPPEDSDTEQRSASRGVTAPSGGDNPDDDLDRATKLVQDELGATEVTTCAVCGAQVDDENMLELSQIRFATDLCREDYMKKMRESK